MPNVLEIPISGTNPVKHITVITMTPQWSEPMETTFNTQTTILETLSGKESRTARLYRPLVGIDFVGIAADQAEHQLYKAIFERWSETGIYAVPLWMDAVNLDADITADETHRVQTFSANGFNRLFRWFRYALLWQSPEHCQIIEIKYINKGAESHNPQIVCRGFDDAKVKMSFNKGDFLVPLAIGSISQPDREFLTNAINTIQISFVEKQGAIKFYSGSDESDSLLYYRNYTPKASDDNNTVYTEEKEPANYNQFVLMPNWDLSENIYRDQDDVYYDALDGGLAKPYIINNKNKLKISLGYTVDRTQLQDIIKFFEYHDGCKGSFLVPTWTADFPEGETPTDYFVVKDDLSVEYMGQSVYNGNDVQFFCKAVMCRFAEDTLEVKALTNNLYEVVCNFVQCACAEHYVDVGGGNTELVGQDIIDKAVYLYELQKNGSATVNRYANYGYGVSANGNNYAAADIAFSEIVKDVEALDNKIEVTCSGLDAVISLNMRVEIKKGTIDSNGTITNVSTIFKGIVTKLSTEANGARLLDVESNLYTFDNDVPRIKLQRQCNWRFGDEQCGISLGREILGKYDAEKCIYVNGNNVAFLENTNFFRGLTVNGVYYEANSENIKSVEHSIEGLADTSNAEKYYKLPLVYSDDTGHSSNEIWRNAYGWAQWYSDKVSINGINFKIIADSSHSGYSQLYLIDKNANLGDKIEIGGVLHYKDFLGKVFQQNPSYRGYVVGAPTLTFKITYFNENLLMSCFYYAPAYVDGDNESDISQSLYLPRRGSTVYVNNTALHVKDYMVEDGCNYIVFEENSFNNINDIGDGKIHYNGEELKWRIYVSDSPFVIKEVYNVLRLKVSDGIYANSVLGNSIKFRCYCNKQISCCKDCYNNVARFGGFPWLPNNTPYEYTQSTSSGKK